jgi:hypothetical protein
VVTQHISTPARSPEDGLDDQKPTWFGGWRNVSKINTILKQRAQKGDRLAERIRMLHIVSNASIPLFIIGMAVRNVWMR